MKKPKIFVALPNTGTCRVELLNLWVHFHSKEIAYKYDVITFYPVPPHVPHDAARNFITKLFLEKTKYDFMLQIDSDVLPDQNILSMADWNLPVVSGAYLVMGEHDINIAAYRETIIDGNPRLGLSFTDEDKKTYPRPIEIDRAGGGALMIQRETLETMKKTEGCWPPFKFQYDEDGLQKIGEDMDFCGKAKKAGFKIYLDRRFPCYNNKSVDLDKVNRIIKKHYDNRSHLDQHLELNVKSNGNNNGSTATG